jgi:hypothetical protein
MKIKQKREGTGFFNVLTGCAALSGLWTAIKLLGNKRYFLLFSLIDYPR